ncbi:MAG: sigma-70 family RNA polymerase sigma factor [Candidatus Magasanikbacteria bacterium]|nr:sigma-70 family RNA polymerase sigma factor [Candidatus Magasanikbacteria bacterium]
MSVCLSIGEIFAEKIKAGLFAGVRRSLWQRHDQEDRFQEGLAQTWFAYQRHYEATGEFLGDAVLLKFCRRRALSLRDHFVPRPRGKWTLDVVEALSRRGESKYLIPEGDIPEPNGRQDPELRLDLARALGLLNNRDREIVLGFMVGESTRELGKRLGRSSSSVSRLGQGIQARLRAILLSAL